MGTYVAQKEGHLQCHQTRFRRSFDIRYFRQIQYPQRSILLSLQMKIPQTFQPNLEATLQLGFRSEGKQSFGICQIEHHDNPIMHRGVDLQDSTRPVREYSASDWSSHHKKPERHIEMVQHRATHIVLLCYERKDSVTDMI